MRPESTALGRTVWHSCWKTQESFLVRLKMHTPLATILPACTELLLVCMKKRFTSANCIGNINQKMTLMSGSNLGDGILVRILYTGFGL